MRYPDVWRRSGRAVGRQIVLLASASLMILLSGTLLSEARAANLIEAVCPGEVAPSADPMELRIEVYGTNDINMSGFSFGFHYNSDDVEIESVDYTGTVVPFPSFFNVLYKPELNMLLVGWADFTFVNPLTPQTDGLFFTLVMTVPGGTGEQCIDIDSAFVPPAGAFIFSPQAGGQLSPDYIGCQVDIGGVCGAEPVPPVAVCAPVTVAADANCEADASIDDGSFDPEGQGITLAQEPPGPYPLGETTVMLIVTDVDGYADTCEALVTVEDVTPPVVDCPANINQGNDSGVCGAVVSFDATATDNCGDPTIVYDPPSGSFFDVGTTPVMVIATDAAGLADTCSFNVTIFDNEFPVVSGAPDSIVVPNDPEQCGAVITPDFEVLAEDNCPGVSIVFEGSPGNFYDVGESSMLFIATDAAGNADTLSVLVRVVDTEAPVAECPGNIEVSNDPGEDGAVVSYSSGVDDNCPGAVVNCSPPSGSFFPLGVSTVECIAEDAAGNADTCLFDVTVNFVNNPPVAYDQTLFTNEDTPVGVQLDADDQDGDDLTFAIIDGPYQGSVSDFDMNAGTFTYTPPPGFNGSDSLIFKAFDGTDSSNVAMVEIIVSGGGKTIIMPDEQYVYYSFAIDPWIDTVYFGNFPEGYTAADVEVSTIKVNNTIVPTTTETLPSHPEFVGEVIGITFPLADLITPWLPLWDTTIQLYTVEGNYSDGMPFAIGGQVTVFGKNSQDPAKYLVPKDQVVVRGDIDKNGRVNMSDVTGLLAFIFADGEPPLPRATADADCSLSVNVADAVYLVAYMFNQQDPPCPVER